MANLGQLQSPRRPAKGNVSTINPLERTKGGTANHRMSCKLELSMQNMLNKRSLPTQNEIINTHKKGWSPIYEKLKRATCDT